MIHTGLLYQRDSYLKEFSAKILETDSKTGEIVLDRTAFYARGGGQPCDTGIIKSGEYLCKVAEVSFREGKVYHKTEGRAGEPGDNVTGIIDWDNGTGL